MQQPIQDDKTKYQYFARMLQR